MFLPFFCSMKAKTEEGLKALLNQSIQTVPIAEFKSKYDEELYIFLENDQDIIEAAVSIVKDDSEKIQEWIQNKTLKKLPMASIEELPQQSQAKFVLIQPYTLFQLIAGEDA